MGQVAAAAGIALVLLLGIIPAAPAEGDAAATATIAKNLAENVLGKGLVRKSRVVNGGRSLEMVWESATFKPSNPMKHTRELLQVEAEFASASIFRVLTDVRDLHFEIVVGKRSLCTGRVSRTQPFRIVFASGLGG